MGRLRGRARLSWLLLILAVVVTGALMEWRLWTGSPGGPDAISGSPGSTIALARRETRPTLDPALFVGKAALAHRVARDIPEVLDQLYCYCQCDKSVGHRSLLSCFTDGHAAT